jgi:hypothetical protein
MNPRVVITLSLITYLSLWVLAPLAIVYEPSTDALVLFSFMFISLYMGAVSFELASKISHTSTNSGHIQEKTYLKIFHALLFLSIFGLILRFIDKIIIRDILSYTSAVERRDSDTSSSIFGTISAPLYILTLTLPAFFKLIQFKLRSKILILFLFLLPSIEVLFMGSRGLFITSFFMLFIYAWAFGKLKFRYIALLAVVGSIFFYVSGLIFIDRIQSYGFSPVHSALNSGYAFTLIPNDIAIQAISEESHYSALIFLIVNATQYYLHGVLEFSYLVDNFGPFENKFGAFTFQTLTKLFGANITESALSTTPRPGVYTTLMGPLWVDFGIFSVIFLFTWGWIMAVAYHKLRREKYEFLPLYAYMAAVVFFAPVVNLIQNALGIYVLTACIFLIIIIRFFTALKPRRMKK